MKIPRLVFHWVRHCYTCMNFLRLVLVTRTEMRAFNLLRLQMRQLLDTGNVFKLKSLHILLRLWDSSDCMLAICLLLLPIANDWPHRFLIWNCPKASSQVDWKRRERDTGRDNFQMVNWIHMNSCSRMTFIIETLHVMPRASTLYFVVSIWRWKTHSDFVRTRFNQIGITAYIDFRLPMLTICRMLETTAEKSAQRKSASKPFATDVSVGESKSSTRQNVQLTECLWHGAAIFPPLRAISFSNAVCMFLLRSRARLALNKEFLCMFTSEKKRRNLHHLGWCCSPASGCGSWERMKTVKKIFRWKWSKFRSASTT